MRAAAATLLILVGGCDALFNIDHISVPPDADPLTIDANVGMLVDAGPCAAPAELFGHYGAGGTGLISVCLTPSSGTLALSGTVNSDSDPRCLTIVQDSVGTDACVIAASSITVTGTIATAGKRPLVLLAYASMTIDGAIDSASHSPANRGAGYNWGGCGIASDGPNHMNGGGGGAGGSFGSKGGDGGPSAGGSNVVARAAQQPDRVRGGCPGGRGGIVSATMVRADGGDGGGALMLIAKQSLTLTANATINASGASGHGGASVVSTTTAGGGGGGGGSGGLIGLDSMNITIHPSARLFANGGGAGAGGGLQTGANGSEATAGALTTPAAGGASGSLYEYGGAGGDGAAGTTLATGGHPLKSGGGGGGAGGVIHLYTPVPPPMPLGVSPAWQTN